MKKRSRIKQNVNLRKLQNRALRKLPATVEARGNMSGLRAKASMKCGCGQAVAAGSVFCPYCQREVQKKNDKITKKEESKYQKEMIYQGRKKK